MRFPAPPLSIFGGGGVVFNLEMNATPAVFVVAYRDRDATDVDVCIVERPTPTNALQRGFFGGTVGFPGGVVGEEDWFVRWPRELLYPDGDFWHGYNDYSWALDADGRNARVAAARYLLEQTGIAETAVGPASDEQINLFRAAVRRDVAELQKALRAQGRQLAVMGPQPLMRWLSPSTDARAFDARFFSLNCWKEWGTVLDPPWEGEPADAPKTQWISARQCLASVRAGERMASPATLEALIWLAETGLSFDRGWGRCANLHNGLIRCSRDALTVVEPKMDGGRIVLPPGLVPVPTAYARSAGHWLPDNG